MIKELQEEIQKIADKLNIKIEFGNGELTKELEKNFKDNIDLSIYIL